jgi:hypothetical protein
MSVLRKKMTAQPPASDFNKADIALVWKEMTKGCLGILEDMTGGLSWTEESFSVEPLMRSEFTDNLAKSGLYAGFGPEEKEICCLCLASTPLAALLNKSGIDGKISNFSGVDDYEASELDLFMMEPFIGFVKNKLIDMMSHQGSEAEVQNPQLDVTSLGEFQKEEIELSAFSFSEEHKAWTRISLEFKARLEENDETQIVSFQVILPLTYLKTTLKSLESSQKSTEDFVLPENAKYLGRHIDTSVTSVRAVLDNLRMSVADCTRLEIGQVLPLPGVSLENISLEVEMRDQRLAVANGLLGIHKTRRAVKLSEDISQEFRGDVIC